MCSIRPPSAIPGSRSSCPAFVGSSGAPAAVSSTGSVIRAGGRRPARRTLGLLAGLVAAGVAGPMGRLVGVGTREGRRRRTRQHAAGGLSGRALEALKRSRASGGRTGRQPVPGAGQGHAAVAGRHALAASLRAVRSSRPARAAASRRSARDGSAVRRFRRPRARCRARGAQPPPPLAVRRGRQRVPAGGRGPAACAAAPVQRLALRLSGAGPAGERYAPAIRFRAGVAGAAAMLMVGMQSRARQGMMLAAAARVTPTQYLRFISCS